MTVQGKGGDTMAAGMLPEPGKVVRGREIGPCITACNHRDCAATRQQAATECYHCLRPIGYGVRFYFEDVTGEGRSGDDNYRMAHAACTEKMAEDGTLG